MEPGWLSLDNVGEKVEREISDSLVAALETISEPVTEHLVMRFPDIG